jgi:hypothetical protein
MKKTFWAWIADVWCRLMHPAPMWPVHGHYRCPACWREYAVPWEVTRFTLAVDRHGPALQSEHPRGVGDRVARAAPSW